MNDDKRDGEDQDDTTDDEWNPWLEDEEEYDDDDGDESLDFEDENHPDSDLEEPTDEDNWEEPAIGSSQTTAPGRFTDTWPLGLVAVAAVALILLAAGGYGIMKQRSAMEQTIRDLQAQLAVAGDPAEIASARASQLAIREENRELQSRLGNLGDENRQLKDTLAGLEQQLLAQQEATAQAKSSTTVEPAQESPPSKPAPTAGNTGWFVNFSSYGNRALAEEWASRLKPASGKVVVSSTEQNGRTLYRVRVVGLATEAQARREAEQLARDYDLGKLWVGRD
ncbi:SPOR domain-containing protein [Kineobactrum sediminis]|nr:SPOR domain-containing protein [Kineobactrum sediminis]